MWARGDMKIQIPQKLGLTRYGAKSTHVSFLQPNDIVAVGYKKFCAVSSLLKKPRRVADGIRKFSYVVKRLLITI